VCRVSQTVIGNNQSLVRSRCHGLGLPNLVVTWTARTPSNWRRLPVARGIATRYLIVAQHRHDSFTGAIWFQTLFLVWVDSKIFNVQCCICLSFIKIICMVYSMDQTITKYFRSYSSTWAADWTVTRDFSQDIVGRYVRPWSLNFLFCRRGFGLVVSVVVPSMLEVLSYARGRGFDSRFDSRSRLLYIVWTNLYTAWKYYYLH
jgi:hypothetical protein